MESYHEIVKPAVEVTKAVAKFLGVDVLHVYDDSERGAEAMLADMEIPLEI